MSSFALPVTAASLNDSPAATPSSGTVGTGNATAPPTAALSNAANVLSSSISSLSAGNKGATAAPAPQGKDITPDNISKLTVYDLRQELKRRDAMDVPEHLVNYKSLLQRLMVEVLKDEAEKVTAKEQARKEQEDAARAEALRVREQRKLEAIERSKQRQAKNPAYFAEKARLNEEAKAEREKKAALAAASGEGEGEGADAAEPAEGAASAVTVLSSTATPAGEEVADDPFAPKRRFKVAVK